MSKPDEHSESAKLSESISDDLFTKVFHASPDSISVSRMSDGVFLDVNEGFERISGYSREEVIGRSSLGFAFWADGPQHRDAFMYELRTKGSVRDFEGRWLTRSNEIRDCLVSGEMIDYQGEKCVVLVITDITDRLRAQRELERSEKLYRSIVADQTEFIVRWLPGGIRTFVNDAYCKHFGVTRDQCIGTSFYDLIPEAWHERVRRKIDSLTPESPVATNEHQVIRPDGSEGWNEWIDRAIFDKSGHLVEYQSVGRDITDRKLAEEDRREAEEQYRRTFESVTNGLTIRTMDGKVVAVNPAMCQLFGYSREEYMELTLPQLMPPEMLPTIEEMRETVKAGRIFAIETKGLHRSGRVMDLEIRVTPIHYRRQAHVLTIAWDVTERKRAENQLVMLNEQLLVEREALDQKNIALREILNHMEQDREKYKHEICESVEKLLLPAVSKLASKNGRLKPKEIATLRNALEAIIRKDIDPYASNLARLSARELDICNLIKSGYTSKQISERLNISTQTVNTHRHAIRRKLQLKNRALNLAAYLRSR